MKSEGFTHQVPGKRANRRSGPGTQVSDFPTNLGVDYANAPEPESSYSLRPKNTILIFDGP